MKIALAGNPNSGKTTLFNAITGSFESVGNWAGVTVSKKEGKLKDIYLNNLTEVNVVDLPGVYSIKPYTSEESIARDFIIDEKPDVIINVVDSNNLNRSLFFTTQLLELGIPVVVALNKIDLVKSKANIDSIKLSKELNCKVVEISAIKQVGIKELIKVAIDEKNKQQSPVDKSLIGMEDLEQQDKLRFKLVNSIEDNVRKKKVKSNETTFGDKIDRIVTNKWLGIIVFSLIMWLVFSISQVWVGAYLADWLVGIIDSIYEYTINTFESLGVNPFLTSLVTEGLIQGIGAVLGFLPLIMVLMFLLALLEDSGYMARVAIIMDPYFKKIGLSGKSIIPMIVGYGCSIPGIMATRTIKDEKQKKMTALLTPFVPCGAKVPIITLFIFAFFPNQAWMAPVTYLVAIGLIILTGLFIKAITNANTGSDFFIIELPEYRLPSIKHGLKSTLETAKSFILKATTIILLCNVGVFILQSYDFSFNLLTEAEVSNSMLAIISKPLAFLMIPLGFGIWQFAAAAVTGFIAKENVVATLAICFAVTGVDGEVLSTLGGLTAVSALAYMYFNLFTPPCFAALGAMRAELKSTKWFIGGIVLQISIGYLVALLVNQIGTLIVTGAPAEGFMSAIIIMLVAISIVVTLITRRRKMSEV